MKLSKEPLVSIIMPSYNSEKYISDSIESILSQTYSNWELLITDDCSTDNTINIISDFKDRDCRIKLFLNDVNSGSGLSRNKSIEYAKGKYIAFLDSDDLWRKSKLYEQIRFMECNSYLFTYTSYQKFDANGKRGVVNPITSVTYEKLLYSNVIGCLTAIYNSEVLGKFYMPDIRRKQDFGLWLDILKEVPKAYCLNKVLADYRCDSGVTSNKFKVLKQQWQFYRDVAGLSRTKSYYFFFFYVLMGALKFIK